MIIITTILLQEMFTETLPLNQRLRAMKNISGPQTTTLLDRIKGQFEISTAKSANKTGSTGSQKKKFCCKTRLQSTIDYATPCNSVTENVNKLKLEKFDETKVIEPAPTTSTVAPKVTQVTNATEKSTVKSKCTDLATCREYQWKK
ncbi:unnamed protein product [Parnassius apollo]|uniref:(apollo) hypothetical protein n=1 Tax=Parnassius apollo TaxID=110799 RepID=A0A8S3XG92_PARAO|nr:unnamed protein product [Parnassius apollo]